MITKSGIGMVMGVLLLLSCKKGSVGFGSTDPLSPISIRTIDTILNPTESKEMKDIIGQEVEKKIFTTIKLEEIKDPDTVLKRLEKMELFLWKYLEDGVVQFIDGDYVQVDENRTILTMEDIDVNRYLNGLAYRKAGLKAISRENYRK
ncbi:hypothetical protein [Myroides sp. WP-1]|uniref:hypothetical protein n=1 Tax=Myroides sp. WP-1 TaxID=2759944 RepID=UPI0015FB63BB|nr:hypothetical protein [Myroides sp. WP-1]MBB1141004.1 hypothetical protein [Myroides sp. WP-1]